ncbi:MAG: FimV/HubP family polar landmark protein [Halofilum sp. (in: g-proteobacteria)]|nr:FimV/HubP family polar landmark protein [Halofilum sp. (in: g-proteobacteria)]
MLALLAAATASGPVAALGLGPARVDSRLNERLEAWIPLHDAGPASPAGLDVGLADAAALPDADAAALRPGTELRFEVQSRPDGGRFIRVTSVRPVTEPFLRFLLRVDGAEGRLLREYTLLLDPPTGVADPAAPVTAAAPAAPGRTEDADDQASARTYGPVQRGESAWEIAMATKAAGASVHQMMAALLQANPEAFPDGNLNRLRTGITLTLPPRSAVTAIPQARAVATYRRAAGLQPAPREATTAAAAGDTADATGDAAESTPTASVPSEAAGAAARLSPIAAARAAPAGDGDAAAGDSAAAGASTGDTTPAIAQRLAALERQVADMRGTLDAETGQLRDTLAAQSRALDALRTSVERIGGRLERIAAQPAAPATTAAAPCWAWRRSPAACSAASPVSPRAGGARPRPRSRRPGRRRAGKRDRKRTGKRAGARHPGAPCRGRWRGCGRGGPRGGMATAGRRLLGDQLGGRAGREPTGTAGRRRRPLLGRSLRRGGLAAGGRARAARGHRERRRLGGLPPRAARGALPGRRRRRVRGRAGALRRARGGERPGLDQGARDGDGPGVRRDCTTGRGRGRRPRGPGARQSARGGRKRRRRA